jgi:excisionase family DNA binding protein
MRAEASHNIPANQDENMNKRNMDIRAAATRIGCSPFTLRTWVRQRTIPYIRVGRRIVFDPSEVEAFLAQNRIPAIGTFQSRR